MGNRQMRYKEIIAEDARTVEHNGITLRVTKPTSYELKVEALDDWGNKVLGYVEFDIGDNKELDPQDLRVDDRFQGQGIAKTMYDYVKSLGYKIVRSWDQTDAGAGFWDKHRGEDVRVWEAFDQPYNSKWEKSDYGDVDANTKLPDGTYLNIMFNQEYDGEGEEVTQVEFHRNNSQEVTGEGDAQRVFATVLDAIQKYIKKYKPQTLIFSASKEIDMDADDVEKFNPESRAKLYDRLVQRYAGAWGYQSQHNDEGNVVRYRLTRTVAEGVAESENNDTAISLSKLGKFHPGADTLAEFVPERATAQYALHPDKWESTFYSLTNKDSEKLKYYGPKKISIPPGTLVGDMAIANKFYRAKTPEEQEQYAELYKQSLKPYPVDVSQYRMPELLIPKQGVAEGKQPGKSVVDAILRVMPVAQEIWFHGSRATGKHRRNSDTDILVVVPDNLVGDKYLSAVRILQKLNSHFDNYDIQPTKTGTNIHRIAQEEGRLLWPKQGVAENTAAGINKMFNNLGDPVYANLQRVALLAMQGRQQEAQGRLNSVIKDASPQVQKKIIDAVNVIKPVTINGKVADSSTLDKSKAHQDWILNTFIPWVQSLLGQQVAEGSLGNVLPWPEVVNKVNSAMKAMGWKGQRRDDGTFMYSTAGRASDDEYYIVIIENEGEGMFHYALGTVEEGDPYIGEQNSLPTTEASISELMNSIREGFGLNENFHDGRNPQDKGDSKRHGVPTKASISTLRKVAKQGGRKGQLAHWMANMKSGRAKAKRK
jgi:predicted nucleotidyltransferase